MQRSILAGFSLSAILISAAHSQDSIDVAKITCDQMRSMENPAAVALWLNGYYAGKRNDTTVDVISLDRNAAKVSEYCASNPEVDLNEGNRDHGRSGKIVEAHFA
jgi:acid stress chaperone HdeB